VTHPAAVCHGKISDDTDLGLVDEFKMVTMFADRNVKVTMTGPRMLAKVAWDEYYDGLPNMMQDLGKLMKRNFRKLKRASCKFVHIDEPLFIISDDNEVKAAVDAINIAIEGVNMAVMTHICQGNYAVGEDYDGQIGHRYFDTGRYPAKLICDIDCDGLLIEYDMTPNYEGLLGIKQLFVGAADVQDMHVEKPETIVERITQYGWLAPEQTLITSTCGMNHLPRDIAFGKLKAMAGAKQILGG
jgi:5-methyltetrahydropteroyltriglutamate--homocysteine methyltransferase